jgi:hypothetical protein
MVFAISVNLVALQLGMLFSRCEDDRPTFGVDCFGKLVALLRLVTEQLAEHLLDILERVAVAVPQEDVVAGLASGLPNGRALLFRGDHNDGFFVAGGE